MSQPFTDTATGRADPPDAQNTRGGKAIKRSKGSSRRRFEARDLAAKTRGCTSPPRQASPSRIDRNSVLNLNRNARIDRETPDACADAPATPPQRAAPRPVRRTRAGTRRTSGPERLWGADSKLVTSRRRPVDAQARPRQAGPSGIDRNSVHRNAHEPDPSHPVPKWRRPRLTPSRTETLGASTARRSRNRDGGIRGTARSASRRGPGGRSQGLNVPRSAMRT